MPDVSSAGAPLRAILFLEQSAENEIVPLSDRMAIWKRLLATLIRPLVTADWWEKELDVLQRIVDEVPCYTMRFDRSGAIVPELEKLARWSGAVTDYVRRVPADSAPIRLAPRAPRHRAHRALRQRLHPLLHQPAGRRQGGAAPAS